MTGQFGHLSNQGSSHATQPRMHSELPKITLSQVSKHGIQSYHLNSLKKDHQQMRLSLKSLKYKALLSALVVPKLLVSQLIIYSPQVR